MHPTEAPALGISLLTQLDDKHALTMQTHMASDCSPAELNAMLDKISAAVDRQALAYRLPGLLRDNAQRKAFLERAAADVDAIDARRREEWVAKNRRGAFKLTPQHKAERDQVMTNIARNKEDFERDKAEIERIEKLLGWGAKE
jgi:hypothetical protein